MAARGRIPEGHSLSITLVDNDMPDGTVETYLVYAEARNSEMGEFLGSKMYDSADGSGDHVTGDWPNWAESVMTTRLLPALVPER